MIVAALSPIPALLVDEERRADDGQRRQDPQRTRATRTQRAEDRDDQAGGRDRQHAEGERRQHLGRRHLGQTRQVARDLHVGVARRAHPLHGRSRDD